MEVEPDAPTERRNPASERIDELPLDEVLRLINEADAGVPAAVAAVLPQIGQAVEAGVRTLRDGGRVHYFGAGTSGRVAFADAAELRPTFALTADQVVAHVAGGVDALWRAAESAEDDEAAGRRDAADVAAGDLVIGVAASGGTPYVGGALQQARSAGATTGLITSNPRAVLAGHADIMIGMNTGPEIITGSTRMKAATAAKLALNTFSTALMVRYGRTFGNLMVCAVPSNIKLRRRAVWTLSTAARVEPGQAADALAQSGDDPSVALVSLLTGTGADEARQALRAAGGDVRAATRLS
ncbi:N-acetylmuramic acid 6-phosphate etherase [Hamadaea tsunoensis]|uniref:N-acetylmuramic acid 6-phosphate etherase n=1 Tax=Hamadaea tsunoensis TaxID=53368 RepID=UPI000486AFB3|nr:N-acetylmuramic acid 6-phosphate etherase [Hamadaea tsunoensis]